MGFSVGLNARVCGGFVARRRGKFKVDVVGSRWVAVDKGVGSTVGFVGEDFTSDGCQFCKTHTFRRQ